MSRPTTSAAHEAGDPLGVRVHEAHGGVLADGGDEAVGDELQAVGGQVVGNPERLRHGAHATGRTRAPWRWPADAYRHTVAAIARLSDSARPWIGTRTTSSQASRTSLVEPPGLVAHDPAVGHGEVRVGQQRRARHRRRHTCGCRAPQRREGRRDVEAGDDRQVEQRPGGGAHDLGRRGRRRRPR